MINDFLFGDAHHIVSKRGYEILHKMNMGSIGSKGIEVGSTKNYIKTINLNDLV
jgi:hypothetical protein